MEKTMPPEWIVVTLNDMGARKTETRLENWREYRSEKKTCLILRVGSNEYALTRVSQNKTKWDLLCKWVEDIHGNDRIAIGYPDTLVRVLPADYAATLDALGFTKRSQPGPFAEDSDLWQIVKVQPPMPRG